MLFLIAAAFKTIPAAPDRSIIGAATHYVYSLMYVLHRFAMCVSISTTYVVLFPKFGLVVNDGVNAYRKLSVDCEKWGWYGVNLKLRWLILVVAMGVQVGKDYQGIKCSSLQWVFPGPSWWYRWMEEGDGTNNLESFVHHSSTTWVRLDRQWPLYVVKLRTKSGWTKKKQNSYFVKIKWLLWCFNSSILYWKSLYWYRSEGSYIYDWLIYS